MTRVRHAATRVLICFLSLMMFTALLAGSVSAADPELPPGLDPGGTAIALIGEGVDYTDPEIATRLARDGEGLVIGWDFVDNDPYPYAPAGSGPNGGAAAATELAKTMLAAYRKARLVPVRINPADPASYARAAAFVARTPARIAAVTAGSLSADEWGPFRSVAEKAGNVLFVLAAGPGSINPTLEVYPAAFRLPNAISAAAFTPVSPTHASAPTATPIDAWIVPRGGTMLNGLAGGKTAVSAQEAVVLAAAHAACAMHNNDAASVEDIRKAHQKLARPHPGAKNFLVHDPMCWYGGIRF